MRRLLPEPGPTTIAAELDLYRPFEDPFEERPRVALNMVTTLDGRAAIEGGSTEVGSSTDTQLLLALRSRFDAVMIGAGTMRVERYGRIIRDPQVRARRERIGLPHDPLAVLLTDTMDLPFDAPLFTDGGGRVLIFTSSEREMPRTATSVRVVRRHDGFEMDEVLRHLRLERGIRALLCEGGPHLHAQLEAVPAVDDMFLTISPKIAGNGAPGILEGRLPRPRDFRLERLLEEDGELMARYGPAR